MAFTEDNSSQLPALKLLLNLDYKYLDTNEVVKLREGREANVILTVVLRERLREINTIKIKGKTTKFEGFSI